MKAWEHDTSGSLVSSLPLIMLPVVVACSLVPNFNPQAPVLVMAVSQWQFFMIYPCLSIEDNFPVPLALPIPSKNLTVLNYGTPVLWFISCSCDSNQLRFLISPQFPSPPGYFSCCVHWCRGTSVRLLGALHFLRSFPKFLWNKCEVFHFYFLKWQHSVYLFCHTAVYRLPPSNII